MANFVPSRARPRRGVLSISLDTFNAIEEWIKWGESVKSELITRRGMDILVRFMAYTNQGIAQRMSAGPLDPQQQRPQEAWKIPVRRITERYYFGWKVRRIGFGTWQLYNDSREAYFIEFGIHVSGRRVRRPIRKLSLRRTMEAMMRTQAYHRCWCEIYANPRKGKHKSRGFTQTVQSPGMGGFTGPMLGRRLP
jgi:hypothetical protein